MTATKAWWAALAGAIVAGASAAIPLINDGLTAAEILTILVAVIVGSGVTGGVVYASPANQPKVQPQLPIPAGGDPDRHSYGDGKVGPL